MLYNNPVEYFKKVVNGGKQEVINIMDKNQIIVRHRNGESNRTIAKKLGISKDTVNKYINEYKAIVQDISNQTDAHKIAMMQEQLCSKPRRKTIKSVCHVFNGDLEKRFYELISIDAKRNELLGSNKQLATAAALHRELIKEGFSISESTIRAKLREYKDKQNECFIKLYYEYGEVAQYDFHQVKVRINNKNVVYHQATISLPKSNLIFGKLYRDEKMESFLNSLVEFFNYSGGVFKKVVFDNMSNVVKRFIYKNGKKYTDDIIKLSTYYGFKIETCNPRKGNEKGHVENSGKIVRKELFTFKYEFNNEKELLEYYDKELKLRNKDCIKEFHVEKLHLLPLPAKQYELGRIQYVKANTYSFVSIDTNFYSVPDKYVDKNLVCIVYTDFINIFEKNGMFVCKHEKKEGKGNHSVDIMHYVNTFLTKPKAFANSLAFKQAPNSLKTIFYKHYSTNPRDFLLLLKQDDALNKIKNMNFEKKCLPYFNDVDKLSVLQIEQTSLLFGQEN